MAVIKCTKCGKDVLSEANACRQCGLPIPNELKSVLDDTIVGEDYYRADVLFTGSLGFRFAKLENFQHWQGDPKNLNWKLTDYGQAEMDEFNDSVVKALTSH